MTSRCTCWASSLSFRTLRITNRLSESFPRLPSASDKDGFPKGRHLRRTKLKQSLSDRDGIFWESSLSIKKSIPVGTKEATFVDKDGFLLGHICRSCFGSYLCRACMRTRIRNAWPCTARINFGEVPSLFTNIAASWCPYIQR